MILELETDEVCRLLVYIESENDDIQHMAYVENINSGLYKIIAKNNKIINKLRTALGVTDTAEELDKLEAMEAQNDTGTRCSQLAQTETNHNRTSVFRVGDREIVSKDLRSAE